MENLFFEIRSVWVVDENQDSDDERHCGSCAELLMCAGVEMAVAE